MDRHEFSEFHPESPTGRPQPAGREPQTPRLWEAFVRAAYEIGGDKPVPPVDGRHVAQVVNGHALDSAYGVALAGPLAALASELNHEEGEAADRVRRRMSELTSALEPKALGAIVAGTGAGSARRQFLDDAAAAFPVDALVRLALVASVEARAELSKPMARLFYKLAVQTRTGPAELRANAEDALRTQVRELVGRWWLVHSDSMTFGFDEMFDGSASRGVEETAVYPGGQRIVLTAIEVDAVGMPVWGPVTQMLADGRFRELLDLVRDAPDDSKAAHAIAQHVATPQRLAALLSEEDVDFDSVDRLAAQMGAQAIPTLLDNLATSDSRATRRGIFDRLAKGGPGIGPAAFERLSDKRWFVQRNVLALLAELGYWPAESSPDAWIAHDDPRVRKEAIRTLLRVPRHREKALVSALRDSTDRQMLHMVLAEAQRDCPDAAIPIIVKRLGDDELTPDLRVAAIRLLGRSRSALALEALLRVVSGGKTLFGRPKLAPKASDVLAALRSLAAGWPNERRVAPLLESARNSKDPDVVAAASGEPDEPAPTPGAMPAEDEP